MNLDDLENTTRERIHRSSAEADLWEMSSYFPRGKLKGKPTIIDDFGHWGMGEQAHKFQKEIFDFFLE